MVAYWAVIIYLRNRSSPVKYSILERSRELMKYLEKL
jgi:hypothetical protein